MSKPTSVQSRRAVSRGILLLAGAASIATAVWLLRSSTPEEKSDLSLDREVRSSAVSEPHVAPVVPADDSKRVENEPSEVAAVKKGPEESGDAQRPPASKSNRDRFDAKLTRIVDSLLVSPLPETDDGSNLCVALSMGSAAEEVLRFSPLLNPYGRDLTEEDVKTLLTTTVKDELAELTLLHRELAHDAFRSAKPYFDRSTETATVGDDVVPRVPGEHVLVLTHGTSGCRVVRYPWSSDSPIQSKRLSLRARSLSAISKISSAVIALPAK